VSDLTVIFLTCNKMPRKWQEFHLGHLMRAVEDRPLIWISAEPPPTYFDRADTTYLFQDPPFCAWNVYRQMLRAARIADTKYVAVAEDDTLYTSRHFSDFRPKDDEIAYDMSRWSVFSWMAEKAYFSEIRKHGNFMMSGPRKLIIKALEERERKWPQGNTYCGEIGRREVETILGLKRNRLVEWHCIEASVNLAHPQGLSPTYINVRGRERKPGEMKALSIPHWGSASAIAKIYNDGAAEEDGVRQ
jgi:hypothetical protein